MKSQAVINLSSWETREGPNGGVYREYRIGGMMKEKFTPGPWEVETRNLKRNGEIRYYITARNGQHIIGWLYGGDRYYTPKNKHGDARLIAQAPALLEALEEMLDAYAPFAQRTVDQEGNDALHSAVRNAREAIAKVTGGNQ